MQPNALLGSCVAFGWLASACLGQTVEETLEKVRAASGLAKLKEQPHGFRLRAEESGYYGERFNWECTFHGHRFVIERTGRLNEKTAYDGVNAWIREVTGETRACELGDLTTDMVMTGIISGRLLAEGTPLKFTIDKDAGEDHGIVLVAPVDQGRAEVSVEIDKATWRARQWRVEIGERNGTIELLGEIECGGVRFPRCVRQASTTLTLTSAEPAGEDAHRYRMTPGLPDDHAFDAKVSASVEAKTNGESKCLLIKPLINGKDLGWFTLDTGSQMNIIDPEAAKEAGLKEFGNPKLTGIALESAPGRFTRAETLTVGPLTMRQPMFVAAKLGPRVVGRGVTGVLGLPFFARCVIEMEADAPRVAVFDPGTYRLPVGEWVPLQFNRYLPLVGGRFEDRAAVFRIDTGFSGTAIMDEPTGRAWKLNLHGPIKVEAGDFTDGSRPLMQITAKSMGLGRTVGKDIPIRFATNPTGKYTDTYSNGMVGMGLCRAAVMVFDYRGRRMAFEPPATWPRGE